MTLVLARSRRHSRHTSVHREERAFQEEGHILISSYVSQHTVRVFISCRYIAMFQHLAGVWPEKRHNTPVRTGKEAHFRCSDSVIVGFAANHVWKLEAFDILYFAQLSQEHILELSAKYNQLIVRPVHWKNSCLSHLCVCLCKNI